MPLINVSVGYPKIDGCEKINAFYEKWTERIGAYAAEFADKANGEKAGSAVRNIRIIPLLRFEDENRADITFDVIVSENGTLLMYKRTAHCWNKANQRLIKSAKRGKETFFDGENTVVIENLFGKIKARRMSEYVKELKTNK